MRLVDLLVLEVEGLVEVRIDDKEVVIAKVERVEWHYGLMRVGDRKVVEEVVEVEEIPF